MFSDTQEAEVGGQPVPEPFDVRTEEGTEVGALPLIDFGGMETSQDSGRSSGQDTTYIGIISQDSDRCLGQDIRTIVSFIGGLKPVSVVARVQVRTHYRWAYNQSGQHGSSGQDTLLVGL